MYGDSYARFRNQQGGTPAPINGGRPRGVPSRYGDQELGLNDMAPEDLAKSLQPVANRSGLNPRRGDPGTDQRRMVEQPRGAGPLVSGGRPPNGQWMQGSGLPYDASGFGYTTPNIGGATPPPQGMPRVGGGASNSYLPPVKYRRVNELEGLEDPHSEGGAPLHHQQNSNRMPMGAYDSMDAAGLFNGGSPPLTNPRAPRSGGYAPYAPPSQGQHQAGGSPTEMMMMMRQRREQEDFRFSASGLLHRPTSRTTPPGGAQWGREMDPMEQVRRIHRELQPPPLQQQQPSSSPWAGPSPSMAAHMRGPQFGNEDSPGSRIVTPASALHTSNRRPMMTGTRGPLPNMRAPPPFEELDEMPLPGMPGRARGRAPRPQAMPQYEFENQFDDRGGGGGGSVRAGPAPAVDHDDSQRYAPPPAPSAEATLSTRKPRKAPAASAKTSSKKRTAAEALASTPSTVASSGGGGGGGRGRKSSSSTKNTSTGKNNSHAEPKRRCGRKSMNYSSEQKRERNRAAVKKCRQRQALKYDYLKRKAEVLASENRALSEMLVKNVELDDEKRNSLTRGIQMDILLKIKEIFTQSLPKDFVLDADSIWDLNSVLAVSMPSRCYYGIESIKDFWRTSLRMRNKGKIRSFWAWLFRLPPGDRFAEFTIRPFAPTSNLYFISWTTKSTPALSGSIVIMFGHGHRVTLHVEIFGWLIWRYLLTNTPFPEPPLE